MLSTTGDKDNVIIRTELIAAIGLGVALGLAGVSLGAGLSTLWQNFDELEVNRIKDITKVVAIREIEQWQPFGEVGKNRITEDAAGLAAGEIARIKGEAAREIARIKGEAATEIARIKGEAATEIARLKDEAALNNARLEDKIESLKLHLHL